jgi:hypothetical protein
MSALSEQGKIFVAPGNDRNWRQAGGQTSFRTAAICGLELQHPEDCHRKSIATDDNGGFLKDCGRRTASLTAGF